MQVDYALRCATALLALYFSAPAMGQSTQLSLETNHAHPDRPAVGANISRPLYKDTIIGARAGVCAASRTVPLFELCYGQSGDRLSDEKERLRDRTTWAAQVELRQHLSARFGAVAFARIGGRAMRWIGIEDARIGLGVRYRF